MDLMPLQAGDVPDIEADVSDLIEFVDYMPSISVEDGVSRFVAWHEHYFSDKQHEPIQ